MHIDANKTIAILSYRYGNQIINSLQPRISKLTRILSILIKIIDMFPSRCNQNAVESSYLSDKTERKCFSLQFWCTVEFGADFEDRVIICVLNFFRNEGEIKPFYKARF